MLRQNSKIIFKDDDKDSNETEKNDKESNETEKEEKSSIDDVTESEEPKREYHSGTESEDEAQDFPIKSKKVLKKVEKPIEEIIEEVPSKIGERQTILLSATLTNAVEKLAGLTMTNPALIDAAEENLRKVGGSMTEINEDLVVPQSVVQSYVVTPPKLRMVTLCAYIAGRCQVGIFRNLLFMYVNGVGRNFFK